MNVSHVGSSTKHTDTLVRTMSLECSAHKYPFVKCNYTLRAYECAKNTPKRTKVDIKGKKSISLHQSLELPHRIRVLHSRVEYFLQSGIWLLL